MKAFKTENSNHTFGPPPGKEDEILSLPCEVMEDEEGREVIRSVWVPTDEERKAISEGQNVLMDMWWIGAFPPVAIGVTDEQVIENTESGQGKVKA